MGSGFRGLGALGNAKEHVKNDNGESNGKDIGKQCGNKGYIGYICATVTTKTR